MSSLFGEDINHHTADFFGSDSIEPQVHTDPWGSNSAGPPLSASNLLRGASIPDIYNSSFNDALNNRSSKNLEQLKEEVSVSALDKIFDQLEFPSSVRKKIYFLVNVNTNDSTQDDTSKIDRGTWNVALALAAFVQKGTNEDNLSLNLVDFSRNSLPSLSFPKGQSQTLNVQTDVRSSNLPKDTFQPSQVWQSNISPSNYNPLSKNTISVSLVSKREGTVFFRHVNYVVEGLVPSSLFVSIKPATNTLNNESNVIQPTSEFSSLSSVRFKVIRRYSDFYWLLESLQKKYPFRLLPILPPKRLSVDGHYLSSDDQFLERRRKGLQRFINLLLKHPLLKSEKLVAIFLSVETELSVWKSSGSALELHEEYHNRIISPDFVKQWDEHDRMEHWRDVKHAAEAARDTLAQFCLLADRISKRNNAMATDYSKISGVLGAFNQTIPLLYKGSDPSTAGDLPVISETVKNVATYLTTSSKLLQEESNSLDSGLFEDVKVLRDTVLSVLEMFLRYERTGGNAIQQLERRIQHNEARLNGSIGNDIRASERDKILKMIESDKRTISYQKNRSWLIRQTITEELDLHQRTQYLIAKLLNDWSNSAVKFAESQSDNWSALTHDIVTELPLS